MFVSNNHHFTDVYGQENSCFDCTAYISNCKPPKNLVFIKNKTADEGKVQPSDHSTPPGSLEECIDPKMKITGNCSVWRTYYKQSMKYILRISATLSNVVCFRAKDGTCGIVGPSIVIYKSLICFECELPCKCETDSSGARVQGILFGVFSVWSIFSILEIVFIYMARS